MGLERSPRALIGLPEGRKFGKLLIKEYLSIARNNPMNKTAVVTGVFVALLLTIPFRRALSEG